jgi:AcrR family transcriptional regulator
MSTAPARSRHDPATTRRRLLRAARRVFLERGFHGASLEAVAHEAGLTKGAVYSRFENKGDLFLALLQELNEERRSSVSERLSRVKTADELVDAVKGWWAWRARQDPAFTIALVEYWTWSSRNDALRERVAAEHTRLVEAVTDVIDEAAARIGVTLPFRAADLVRLAAGLARGVALERQLVGEEIDDRTLDWLFRSLAPAEDASRRTPDSAAPSAEYGRR